MKGSSSAALRRVLKYIQRRGPMHSSCMYCDFAQACHRDSCKHANRYIAAVKAEKFWEELERRERHG